MSMCHKAYAFDHAAFMAELAPILYEALETGDDTGLAEFIDANSGSLTLPWEAEPLPLPWRSVLERGDVQELGDLALTKYYDADDDCGVQEQWMDLQERLPENARPCLLGEPFGPRESLFDPGRQGSYFQAPETAAHSKTVLQAENNEKLGLFFELLGRVAKSGTGLYVTF